MLAKPIKVVGVYLSNMPFDYYKTPSQEVFDDIKANAIKLWQTYDDRYGYATEKISRIEDLTNITDNAWYMVAMFDSENQLKLIEMCQPETAVQIIKALQG